MSTKGQERSDKDSKAITLLGQGLSPGIVSTAVGLTPARISQLLSDPEYSKEITELRFQSLSAFTQRDKKYDVMEDELLEKLNESLYALEGKPLAIAKVLSQINSANRRGSVSQSSLEKPSEVVTLNMPTVIVNQYIKNVNNQVIKAGNQELVTVQSSGMNQMLEAAKAALIGRNPYEIPELERVERV